jgi:hypothetical protein
MSPANFILIKKLDILAQRPETVGIPNFKAKGGVIRIGYYRKRKSPLKWWHIL